MRIKEARERAGLSQRDLARALGVSAATLSGYEKGSHAPRPEALSRIADLCGVTAAFLLGRAEEGQGLPSAEAMALARIYDRLDDLGREALKTLADIEARRASALQPAALREEVPARGSMAVDPWPLPSAGRGTDHLQAFSPVFSVALPGGGLTQPPAAETRRVRLRRYDSPAAAGLPNDAESAYTDVDYPAALVPGGTQYAVGVSGASMEPDIPDGATVFVGPAEPLMDGDIVIAWIDGEGAVCKRVCLNGQTVTRLMSANRDYPDITGHRLSGVRINGRVMGTDQPDSPRSEGPVRMTDRERGAALRERRRAVRQSGEDLARILGVSELTLRRWEDGAVSIPPARLQRLCEALSLDPYIWK